MTLRQALSALASKFRRSDSEGSSSSSSADSNTTEAQEPEQEISPLALMNETSAEAWLGRFLLMLHLNVPIRYATFNAAMHDEVLLGRLRSVRDAAQEEDPMRLLEPGYAERLKAKDWSAWWRAEDALNNYCCSVLALTLLGDRSHMTDVGIMYRQSVNLRVQKDAHYVLCNLLRKPWPGYDVRSRDIERLREQAPAAGNQ